MFIVALLDKMLYIDYLCLVASNKQQIYMVMSQTSNRNLGKRSTPKWVQIRPKIAPPTLSWGRKMKMHHWSSDHNVGSLLSRLKTNSFVFFLHGHLFYNMLICPIRVTFSSRFTCSTNKSNQINWIHVTAKSFAAGANFFFQCSSLFLCVSTVYF